MSYGVAIENARKRIADAHKITKGQLNDRVYRGHSRSISTDIEDSIALLIYDIIPNDYYLILDPSIYVNKQNHRPDLLIVNGENKVVGLVEIKANMGWCRNASGVLNNLKKEDNIFKENKILKCKLSSDNSKEVNYPDDVKLFLVALTGENGGGESRHQTNKENAQALNIKHFILFDGWYDALRNRDAEEFAIEIAKL